MLSFIKKTYLQVVLIPVLMILLGAASNQVVLIANQGKFPVMLNDAQIAQIIHKDQENSAFSVMNSMVEGRDGAVYIDDVHSIMRHEDNLKAMADVFNLRDGIYSVGDFLIMLGDWLFQFAPIAWAVLVFRKLSE